MEDYRFKGNVEKRLDSLEKDIHNLSQELKQVLKEIEELKYRVMEDDCR